jgi:hypothetical protein
VTFAIVLPHRELCGRVGRRRKSRPKWLIALGIAVVFNVVTYAPPWMVALPGLRFRQALPFTQASTALTYVAPGGGIVGMAGSYGLLRTWGFGSSEVARAVTITGIWNQLANLLLPVLAVLLLSFDQQRDALLTTASWATSCSGGGRRARTDLLERRAARRSASSSNATNRALQALRRQRRAGGTSASSCSGGQRST